MIERKKGRGTCARGKFEESVMEEGFYIRITTITEFRFLFKKTFFPFV